MNHLGPTHEVIVHTLGKAHDSKAVSDFLTTLGISWGDIKRYDDPDLHLYIFESKERGFSVQFEDVTEVLQLDGRRIGEGPFVLTDVSFWGYAKGFIKYHQLPIEGVTFESTVAEVEEVLGPSMQTVSGIDKPYQWQRESYKISMHWFNTPKKNRVVTYWYTPEK